VETLSVLQSASFSNQGSESAIFLCGEFCRFAMGLARAQTPPLRRSESEQPALICPAAGDRISQPFDSDGRWLSAFENGRDDVRC
jgi:hypothetical protein